MESPQQEAFIARKINFFSWCYKKQTNPMETALLKTPITRSEEEEGPSDAEGRGHTIHRDHEVMLDKDQVQSERGKGQSRRVYNEKILRVA